MHTIVHGFDWPDRIVVGAVGEPGSRTFYLQARDRARIVSVALEKEQSAVLAEKIEEILDQLMTRDGNPFSIPAETPAELVDNDPLEQPIQTQFRTAALSLGWDSSTAQIVIEAYPLEEPEENLHAAEPPQEQEPTEMLVVRIPVGTARAFTKRILEVVSAGRPRCPLCGNPMDPDGHLCPMPGDV
ncbi:MAG: DUF3090 domain-containing protein [Microbacteriaceae bacterium]